MAAKAKPKPDYVAMFEQLTAADLDTQLEAFLKSFIFDLGKDWKELNVLLKAYRKRLSDANEGKEDLNPIMAADFLQKNGLERTALQRKEETQDIDLDNNGRIAFIEYLLLHYKVMILKAYYKRTEQNCPYDLTKGGIGITGVGPVLLEELFTMPVGLDPALEAAIEEFTAQKKARAQKRKDLEERAKGGGVKGLGAVNELKQMDAADSTELNRLEITLEAAKRKAAKGSGAAALAKKKAEEEKKEKEARQASRNKLKSMAAMWENK